MIHITLGTMGNNGGKGQFGYIENVSKQFETAEAAKEWWNAIGLNCEDMVSCIDHARLEYVGAELEVRSEDDKFTNMTASIEGQEGIKTYNRRHKDIVAHKIVQTTKETYVGPGVRPTREVVQMEVYGTQYDGENVWVMVHIPKDNIYKEVRWEDCDPE